MRVQRMANLQLVNTTGHNKTDSASAGVSLARATDNLQNACKVPLLMPLALGIFLSTRGAIIGQEVALQPVGSLTGTKQEEYFYHHDVEPCTWCFPVCDGSQDSNPTSRSAIAHMAMQARRNCRVW